MQVQNTKPFLQSIEFPVPASVSFDLNAFNAAIKAHGLRFVHYRAMRNPIGMIDKYDSRRPNPDAKTAVNGMLYTKAGTVTALCIGNTKETKASDAGMVDSSTAQFTPLALYEDTKKRVFLAPFDRLFLEEESVLVSRQELVEASPTGIDRPKFPAIEILDCVDSRGNRYTQCVDFDITSDGLISWGDRRPGQEIDTAKGVVYSIRYCYRPHWYVARLIHEIRMAQQQLDYVKGTKTMVQAPQSALIQREFVFESEAADSGTRAAAESPADGQLTAR
jgi:hypothetical protein